MGRHPRITTAILGLAVFCLGNNCGSSNGGAGATGGQGGAGGSTGGLSGAIEGYYVERYTCRYLDAQSDADKTCAGVDVRLVFEIRSEGGQYVIDDLGSNWLATETAVANDVLDWTAEDSDFPGFSEMGSWTFQFPQGEPVEFTKASTFQTVDGTPGECIGTGIGVPDPNDPAEPAPLPSYPCTLEP